MRFRATVAIGDKKGRVGIGIGKANEFTAAIQKAITQAKKSIIRVPIFNNTIPHDIKIYENTQHSFYSQQRSPVEVAASKDAW